MESYTKKTGPAFEERENQTVEVEETTTLEWEPLATPKTEKKEAKVTCLGINIVPERKTNRLPVEEALATLRETAEEIAYAADVNTVELLKAVIRQVKRAERMERAEAHDAWRVRR